MSNENHEFYYFPEFYGVEAVQHRIAPDMHGQIAEKKMAEPAVYGAVNVDPWGKPRIGDWIQTKSGVKFHLLDPRPEDFLIEDICWALSNVCRFTGHVSKFYSVGEHSVRVSRFLRDQGFQIETQYAGLMHDSSEAYISDMARPFKQLPEFSFYREIEDKLMVHIASAFKFANPMPAIVKKADEILLGTEARDLMGDPIDGWHFRYEHLKAKIRPWSPRQARREFMKEYDRLNPFSGKKPRRFFFF